MAAVSSPTKPVQLPDAEIEWNPEPVKGTVKGVCRVYSKAASAAAAAGLEAAAADAYPEMPTVVRDAAINCTVQKGEQVYQKRADEIVDTLYSSKDSFGSRLFKWYR